MNQQTSIPSARSLGKFSDPAITATGDARATVSLEGATTLWFNTGTLCNIECLRCYIESSPSNDQLVYIDRVEVEDFLDQIGQRGWPVREIGFTGGEPFMNPDIIEMTDAALARGYSALILTNAMAPMMRNRVQEGLRRLVAVHGDRLTLRISLDHYAGVRHDEERGVGAFDKSLVGMRWLRDIGANMTVAGRTFWGEDEASTRQGYADLFRAEGFAIDPGACVLFPEMDETIDVPEITTACWGLLGKSPSDVMCSSSRMVVKRRGAARPAVLACTLIPYDPEFELGATLAEAERPVALNHPHCSKFCVLGGASCSA